MSENCEINAGTEVTIALRCPCNYTCYYCVAANKKDPLVLHSLDRIKEIYEKIGSFTLTTLECGAGEPIIHPQIKDILEICTESGPVTIPTNNSLSPKRWLPGNHPERLLVRTALHPQAEKRLDRFLERLLYLKDIVADLTVIYVVHPGRFDKIEEYKELFSKHKITLDLTAYNGKYQDKRYPESYTPEERKILGLSESSYWYHRLVPEMTCRNFSGIPCLAGYRTMYIAPGTDFQRCLYDDAKIKGPFDKALPCRVKECGCGLFLEELNTYQIEFWNNLRKISGVETLPQGPDRTNEELYREKKAKYLELMERYGKLKERTGKSSVENPALPVTLKKRKRTVEDQERKPVSGKELSHTNESFLGKAFWKHREAIGSKVDLIRKIIEATGSNLLFRDYQWTQFLAFILEFKPDLILEIGRVHGMFTFASMIAKNMMRPHKCEVVSFGQFEEWKNNYEKIDSFFEEDWFDARFVFQEESIYYFPFEKNLGDAKRILLLWVGNDFEYTDCILGRLLPQIADLQHAVIVHPVSDARFLSPSLLQYKDTLWVEDTVSGPTFIIGNVYSYLDKSLKIMDFSARNGVTFFSADMSLHEEFGGDSERMQQMRKLLGRDCFSMEAQWRWFSLNETPFEPTFPTLSVGETPREKMGTASGPIWNYLPLSTFRPDSEEAEIEYQEDCMIVSSPAKQWSYVVFAPIEIPGGAKGPLRVIVEARVLAGKVGFGVLNKDKTDFIVERAMEACPYYLNIQLEIPSCEDASCLVLRTWAEDGQVSRAIVSSVKLVERNVVG